MTGHTRSAKVVAALWQSLVDIMVPLLRAARRRAVSYGRAKRSVRELDAARREALWLSAAFPVRAALLGALATADRVRRHPHYRRGR
jgi:hypothetical protein